jgi:hypothetical protein
MDIRTNYAEPFGREADSLSVLEQNVKDFPASAIARFSLLYHYKKNNNPEFEKFADQSSLYFNNSYWLQEQLARVGAIQPKASTFVSEPSLTALEPENPHENPAEFIAENDSATPATIEEEAPPVENLEIIGEETPALTHEELMHNNHDSDSHESVVAIDEESPNQNNKADFIVNPEGDITETDNEDHSKIDQEGTKFTTSEEESVGNVILNEGEPEICNNVEDFPAENSADLNEVSSEELEKPQEGAASESPEVSNFSESQQNPEEMRVAIETTENESVEDDIVAFEPLHTIDYFASQGIKIKEDALTNDKLGQQVKSFTAWLKSMKKLHPGKLPEQNEVIERIIQSSAEESNADAEVLTEAMAEVLVKQNKVGKAIEMYEKLSLINPSKSTYFAAKIEILKTR